jgi:hypothetical protein
VRHFTHAGHPTRERADLNGLLDDAISMLRPRLRPPELAIELRAGEIPPATLRRIDACHSAATGLAMIDIIRGAEFQARHLLLARRGGDPRRLTQALAAEAVVASTIGKGGARRAQVVVRQTEEMAQKCGDPASTALAAGAAGFSAFQLGDWRGAYDGLDRAEAIFRQCANVAWEMATAQSHLLFTLAFLGRFGEAGVRGRRWLRDARERGDLYAVTMLRLAFAIVNLAEDDPETARTEAEEALAEWSQRGFHLQHFHLFQARARCSLYSGDAATAYQVTEASWPELCGSLLMRFQIMRITALNLRAQVTVGYAAVAEGSERKRLLRAGRGLVHKLARERTPWSDGIAQLYAAALATIAGETERGVALLAEAERGFAAAEMAIYAGTTQRRRGELIGGDEGGALVAAADASLRACGIVHPARFAAFYVPIGPPRG